MSTSPSDIIDTEQPDAPSPEAIAFQSETKTWKGIKLAPFAIDREGAWIIHRHMIAAPPLPDIIEDIPAMTLDAMRVLWFCSHDPKAWIDTPDTERLPDLTERRLTAKERAQRLESTIAEWGREHIKGDDIHDAVSMFYSLFASAHSTHATIASDGRTHGLGN